MDSGVRAIAAEILRAYDPLPKKWPLVVVQRRPRGRYQKLSPALAAALVQKAREGTPLKVLSMDFGISVSAARIYCYRGGVLPQYVRSPYHRVD